MYLWRHGDVINEENQTAILQKGDNTEYKI